MLFSHAWNSNILVPHRGGFAGKHVHQISKKNGNVEEMDESPVSLEEKASIRGVEIPGLNGLKKRPGSPDSSDLAANHNLSSKRTKSLHVAVKSEQDVSAGEDNKHAATGGDAKNAHVQQLVAMFGTLIAQGENAIGSLEILIASISADLLAEVVMASMRNLPLNFPSAEQAEETLPGKGLHPNVNRDAQLKQLLSILGKMLPIPNPSLQIDLLPDLQPSEKNDTEITEIGGEQAVNFQKTQAVVMVDYNEPSVAVEHRDKKALEPLPCSSSDEV